MRVHGFTLVEMLIALVLLGALYAFAVSGTGARYRATESRIDALPAATTPAALTVPLAPTAPMIEKALLYRESIE